MAAIFPCSAGHFSSVVTRGGYLGGGLHDATLGIVAGCLGQDCSTEITGLPKNVDHAGKVTIIGTVHDYEYACFKDHPMMKDEPEYTAKLMNCAGEAFEETCYAVLVAENGLLTSRGNPVGMGDHAVHASWSDTVKLKKGAPVVLGWRVHFPDNVNGWGYTVAEYKNPWGEDMVDARGPGFGLTCARAPPTTSEFEVGDRVQGYFKQEAAWQTGVVVKVHGDSCDVTIGDTEANVPVQHMRKDDGLISPTLSASLPNSTIKLVVGDNASAVFCRPTLITVGSAVSFCSERYGGGWDNGTVISIAGTQCDIKLRTNPGDESLFQNGVELARVIGGEASFKCKSSPASSKGAELLGAPASNAHGGPQLFDSSDFPTAAGVSSVGASTIDESTPAVPSLPRQGKCVRADDYDPERRVYDTVGQHATLDFDVLLVFDTTKCEVRACVGWGGAGARVDKITLSQDLWPSEDAPLVPFVTFDTGDFGGFNNVESWEALPIRFEALSRDQMDGDALKALGLYQF